MKLNTLDYSEKVTVPSTAIKHQGFSTERKHKNNSKKNLSKRNQSAHQTRFQDYRKIKSKNDREDIYIESGKLCFNFIGQKQQQQLNVKQTTINKQSIQSIQSINFIFRSLQQSKSKKRDSLIHKGPLQHNFVKLKKLNTNMQHYRNEKNKQTLCKESNSSNINCQQSILKSRIDKPARQTTLQLFRKLVAKPFDQIYQSPILKISSKIDYDLGKRQSESTVDQQTIFNQRINKKVNSTIQPALTRQLSSSSSNQDKQLIKNQFRFKNIKVKRTLSNKNQAIYKNREINKEKQFIKSSPLLFFTKNQIAHIKAQSFIITQYPEKQVIVGNFSRRLAQIASLTKIMTFYTILTLKNQFNRNIDQQTIQIDQHIQSMSGTTAQLFEGDIYTVKQLLYGMMLPSGNDAATALAKWGGKILIQSYRQKNEQFIQKSKIKTFLDYMNKCTKNIGMKLSNFENPHGLPNPKSKSNPEQLTILIHQCLSHELFLQIVSTKIFKCWTTNQNIKRQIIWENTNKLLRRDGFIGVKTGVTVTAGPCLASCYKIDDKIFTIVLLRTSKLSRRFKQTRYLLGMALGKLDKTLYKKNIKRLYYQDPQLDSDNSQDEQEFDYNRNDQAQIAKRNKILSYEM